MPVRRRRWCPCALAVQVSYCNVLLQQRRSSATHEQLRPEMSSLPQSSLTLSNHFSLTYLLTYLIHLNKYIRTLRPKRRYATAAASVLPLVSRFEYDRRDSWHLRSVAYLCNWLSLSPSGHVWKLRASDAILAWLLCVLECFYWLVIDRLEPRLWKNLGLPRKYFRFFRSF